VARLRLVFRLCTKDGDDSITSDAPRDAARCHAATSSQPPLAAASVNRPSSHDSWTSYTVDRKREYLYHNE